MTPLMSYPRVDLGTADLTGTYLNYFWVSLAVIAVICTAMWWGWRQRKSRQSSVAAPPPVPEPLLENDPEHHFPGMIVGTVFAADYLDRIAVHGLGIRTNGILEIHTTGTTPGVVFLREGSENIFVSFAQARYVRTDSGLVGKFVEKDGIVLLGWMLGDDLVETGFRLRNNREKHVLLEALESAINAAKPHQPDQKDSAS